MSKTNVAIVADLSGSMQGGKEAKLRTMVNKMLDQLRQSGAEYEIMLVPFSDTVQTWGPYATPALASNRVPDPATHTPGFGRGTALRDAIGKALVAFQRQSSVPTLVAVFSDGEECSSWEYSEARLRGLLTQLEQTGNLTVTFAGPDSARSWLAKVGVPEGNFQAWDGSEKAMAATEQATTQGLDTYIQQRKAGRTRSVSFYADLNKIANAGAVRSMAKKVEPTEVRQVSRHMAGRAIADFYGGKFKPGAHYYELIKAETLPEDRDMVVYIKDANEYRQGSRSLRILLGLPETGKVRVRPGPVSDKYQLFMCSTSVNRKVVEGQTMLTIEP